jgi:hypothetical protein
LGPVTIAAFIIPILLIKPLGEKMGSSLTP